MGGDTFGGQLELHHSSSPTKTSGASSLAVGLPPRAVRAHLWQKGSGEMTNVRHDLERRKEGERERENEYVAE